MARQTVSAGAVCTSPPDQRSCEIDEGSGIRSQDIDANIYAVDTCEILTNYVDCVDYADFRPSSDHDFGRTTRGWIPPRIIRIWPTNANLPIRPSREIGLRLAAMPKATWESELVGLYFERTTRLRLPA